MDKKYSYYPGCSLHSTGIEYGRSFKLVAQKLGMELEEVPNWICCGTSPAHSSSHLLSISLPIKNLTLVESMASEKVVVPCAACYSRFKFAVHEIEHDKKLAEDVKEVIGTSFQNKVKIMHPLEIFSTMTAQDLKAIVKKKFSDLKVVCYYGCLLTRPPKVAQFAKQSGVPTDVGDNPEYPTTMDKVLKDIGFNVLDWSYKTDCCGASFALSETDAVLTLTQKILKNAKAVGANAIAVACPLCHSNLDTRQSEINAKYNTDYNMPIYYFTQLMGLAFGCNQKELGITKHLTPAMVNSSE